ncbi:unnamed protein product [Mytilus edulis]|uniref:CxC2-like cysteine cluster KDZ transposase-associated domain-containing protein n=1 Tax=Mytilus edulis TaxID=6550 RepID=A0A8S3VI94_MYTED|nr:unnamed protein product [Mytilus edulis]
MKRIHFKRKPPKVKRTVFDGTRTKTKYVRMTPVVAEDVKIEEVTHQNNEKRTFQTIFSCPENSGSCTLKTTKGNTGNTYSEKRKKVMEAWDLLREKLLVTRIEEFSPASYSCCFCDSQEQEIIYCQDCGPTAYYCHTCCMRIHKNILFHKPHQWKQSMYVPMLMTNELARKDHVCETSYSSTIYAVDVKGSQHVCKINLCRCEDPAVTLLRYSLWPATPTNPRISFDLRFMELLSILQLECCLPAKSFCEALEALHSNYIKLISNAEKNIYRSVVGDCLTEYNFHRSSLNTRKNITESSFSTECPICLKTPSIVSMDANFGLVHKCSSGIDQGRQSARHKNLFFLDHGDLKKFIDDYAVETKSTNSECSNFQAGSVISVCKHDIPIYFADLAHGERLSYPVYILKCVLENRPNDHLVVMYDIACMLHKHLQVTIFLFNTLIYLDEHFNEVQECAIIEHPLWRLGSL